MTDLADMKLIADLVPQGTRVLDLGCGDGRLLEHLQNERQCTGYGVERNEANVLMCARRKVNVIQIDLEDGLSLFEDQSCDVVLQLNALQHLYNTAVMLKEAARIGRVCIVTFPNFAHWPNRLSVLQGIMPVTKQLPYQWYETPNIRVGSYSEIGELAINQGLEVVDSFGIHKGSPIRVWPNLRASVALFQFRRSEV